MENKKPSVWAILFFGVVFAILYGVGGMITGTSDTIPVRAAYDAFFGYVFAGLYWTRWA